MLYSPPLLAHSLPRSPFNINLPIGQKFSSATCEHGSTVHQNYAIVVDSKPIWYLQLFIYWYSYPILILRATSFCYRVLHHTASLLLQFLCLPLWDTRNALIPFFFLSFFRFEGKRTTEAIMDLRLVFSRSQLLSYLLHDWIWDILMKITSIDSINRWILVLWAASKLFEANICLRWII